MFSATYLLVVSMGSKNILLTLFRNKTRTNIWLLPTGFIHNGMDASLEHLYDKQIMCSYSIDEKEIKQIHS